MEFRRESEMLGPVAAWLQSLGLTVKTEVANPWGICDLVGCRLSQRRVADRLALKQRRSIGPRLRIMVLNRIPDVSTHRSTSLASLQRHYAGLVDGAVIAHQVERLVSDRFVSVTSKGTFQKINGWMPLHEQLVVVELKLSRFQEALHQAVANRDLTHDSYVAFPFSAAERLMASKEKGDFLSHGIGVVGVTPTKCTVLLPPSSRRHYPDPIAQIHCAEQFWRVSLKGS